MLDIAGATAAAALLLIAVHGPDKQKIAVNVMDISSIREPRKSEGHFSSQVGCLIFMTGGKWLGVTETCAQVVEMIEQLGE